MAGSNWLQLAVLKKRKSACKSSALIPVALANGAPLSNEQTRRRLARVGNGGKQRFSGACIGR
jgi:hypothetical protein